VLNTISRPGSLVTTRTAINWWAIAGYDENTVMSWCGHSTARLTIEVYRRVRPRATDGRIGVAVAAVPDEERRHLRRVA
jgi:integrase